MRVGRTGCSGYSGCTDRETPIAVTLTLVRHAESLANAAATFAGRSNADLSERGRRQAEALRVRLAGEDIDRILTSDLARAADTAAIIAAGRSLPISADTRLREMDFGEWEGHRADALAELFADDWEAVLHPDAGFGAPGGETLASVRARMLDVYRDAIAPGGADPDVPGGATPDTAAETHVVIVSHGNALGALIAALLDVPYANSWRLLLDVASISRIRHVDETPVLTLFNDCSHLADGAEPGA